jgi:hypothetical protein
VSIVAAGVHTAFKYGTMGKIVGFVYRQRIHVGPQAYRPLAASRAQHPDDTSFGQASMRLDPKRGQFTHNYVRRARFAESQLGMGMQVAANRLQSCARLAVGVEETGTHKIEI